MTDETLNAALDTAQKTADFNGVVEITTELARRHPDEWRPLFSRGLARIQLGAFREAAHDFQTVLSLTSESTNAVYNLAYCRMKLNLLPEALDGFRTYLKSFPEDADALGNVAVCEERLTRAAQPEARDPDGVAGRDVLRALGGFLGGLALVALGFGVMFLGMHLSEDHPAAGWPLIVLGFCGFLAACLFAIQMKVRFAVLFWCWFFPWVFSIRAGRSIFGLGSLGLGAWIAWNYYGALYTNGHFRMREFLAVSTLIAVTMGVGAGLLLVPHDEDASPASTVNPQS